MIEETGQRLHELDVEKIEGQGPINWWAGSIYKCGIGNGGKVGQINDEKDGGEVLYENRSWDRLVSSLTQRS